MNYVRITVNDVPPNVRFDVPARNSGQTVEVAYGGFDRYEHDEGAPFKRVRDRSVGTGAADFFKLQVQSLDNEDS